MTYPSNLHGQLIHPISKERIDVPVSNLTVGLTDSENIVVSGIITNNSTYPIDDIVVDASMFDANGELINNENRFVLPPSSILEPGSNLEFRFFVIAEGALSYNISAFGTRVS
jgi:hypothetical protein